MTRKRDRFFALMGAALFLVTSLALSVAVIFDIVTNKADPAAKPDTSQQESCSISQTTAPAEKLPSDYEATAATTDQLQTTDITKGTGVAAKSGDCLNMKYYGTLATDGTVFDENYTKDTGLQFQLGQGQVISGWDQGIEGMQVGGVRRLVIPANLAYGDQAQGSIPANSTLVFLVKLVSIQ